MVTRDEALDEYRQAKQAYLEQEAALKKERERSKDLDKKYQRTEDDLKALQSVGQIIGEVLKDLGGERFIVKASSGPRYVVGCRKKVDRNKLTPGCRVSLDMTTLTIMRRLPREVDPAVFNMASEDPGKIVQASIGGLSEQIRKLKETIELPLTNPELFIRVSMHIHYIYYSLYNGCYTEEILFCNIYMYTIYSIPFKCLPWKGDSFI